MQPSKQTYGSADNQAGKYEPLPTGADGAVVLQSQRQWNRNFWCCFGDCNGTGWASCCLVYWLPCVAFGLNRQKVFGRHGVLWGLLLFAAILAHEVSYYATLQHRCYYIRDTAMVCGSLPSYLGLALGFLALLATLTLGIVNRIQMRRRLGIPGDEGSDFLMWWSCQACALCQETRTLMHNNVKDGVWQGPHVMVTIPAGTQLGQVQGQPFNAPAQQVHDAHPGYQQV